MKNASSKTKLSEEESERYLSESEAAQVLGISIAAIKQLEKEEVLHPVRWEKGTWLFSAQDLAKIQFSKGTTLSEEAAQIGAQLQKESAASLSFIQKLLITSGSFVLGYLVLIIIVTISFTLAPLQTAGWLGYIHKPLTFQQPSITGQVLAAATTAIPLEKPSFIQTVLQPAGDVSLGIIKYANPQAYQQIAQVTILNPNDILLTEQNGSVVPLRKITFLESSLLEVADSNLISNLNAEYLQGKKPGVDVGNIAIIGEDGTIEGITQDLEQASTGLTNANFSGSAGITNANLANSGVTITTTGPLSGGGAVSLGGGLTLDCPSCVSTDDDINLTSQVTDTLPVANGGTGATSFTANGILYGNGSNGLQTLTPGTSGYVLQSNGTGSAPSWVASSGLTASSFTGSLTGDVTGAQSATVVEKINGNALGSTTPTSGNLLIGNGSTWVTQQVTSDATIASTGVLTLKNTGTAGTYGSSSSIPVLTTDAQGRITGVTNTAIAGLTTTHFSSTNISQWTNNAGYITSSSTDTLTNKTIAAGSNTISGLTNSNLSGSAGITNANLANSGLTINTTGPLSGGGAISLGGALTLTCSTCLVDGDNLLTVAATSGTNATIAEGGTLTLTAGSNMTTTNNGSGAVTFATSATPTFTTVNGLTITNNGTNTLTLATGKTLTTNNTLTFSGTDGTTLTFQGTDTYVGRTTTDTLTNKTLTSPTINGTVATTGLTLPAFTASGNITGSGSPTISSFGAINGLTLTAASDGFTVAGGTTARTLTVTGADITIGSLIQPTASGALAMQSNGANTLTLDAGGAAGIILGTTNASALTIGRSGVTTTINGIADANNLKIGSGTTITKHLSGTNTFDAAGVALGSCGDLGTVTVTGAAVGDIVTATPTAVSGGVETLLLIWNAYVSSTNTVTIRACSVATLGTQNPASQTWRADVWQH